MPDNKKESPQMLVVGRDAPTLRSLWAIGAAHSWHMEVADSGWDALERLQSGCSPDLLIINLPRNNGDSLHTLRSLRRIRPDLVIILLSHSRDPNNKLDALRLGVQEFLVRPLEQKHLEKVIRRCLGSRSNGGASERTKDGVEQVGNNLHFVATSLAMQKLRTQLELLAHVDVPVLIVGECGTGKEVAARLIHNLSARATFTFLKVNCAALSAHLLESELFGYERGAFAGALHTKSGKLELVQKGTVLLDEIGELPPGLQAKLLQVLQDKQCFRLGGQTEIDVDVRLLAATSINIEQALTEKKLREDLYYRLSAFTLQIPPLRERREEIPVLIQHFMHQMARHYGLPARTVSPVVLDACQAHSWPGNLRELENFVKRYLVIGDEERALRELESGKASSTHQSRFEPTAAPDLEGQQKQAGLKTLLQTVKGETEKNAIAAALDQTRWNRKAAARLLKVSYRTLLYKIEQHHMSPPSYVTPYPAANGVKGNGQARESN